MSGSTTTIFLPPRPSRCVDREGHDDVRLGACAAGRSGHGQPWPIAGSGRTRTSPAAGTTCLSFDDVVGRREKPERNGETKSLCGFEVDDQVVSGGQLHGKLAGLCSL